MSVERVEQRLRELSEWEGETPRLWERAIDGAGARSGAGLGPWYARRWVWTASSVAALLLIALGVLVPNLGPARSSHRVAPGTAAEASSLPRAPSIDLESVLGSSQGGGGRGARAGGLVPSEMTPGIVPLTGGEAERAVVRKATMEIRTEDVRAAALRAQQLLSEPRGEYVESADIDDSDEARPRADLVLRVEATRLEEVLTQLRDLGEVATERVDAEDVTDQMVDLGARIENERRVEAELLELLETRANDELEDILAVRRELNAVRERIERLAAQQERLSRIVRLARVAVLFRTHVTETEPEAEAGVWERFVERLGQAWADGLDTLLLTIAALVRVLVGGAIWFGIAIIAAALGWRNWRRQRPRPLPE